MTAKQIFLSITWGLLLSFPIAAQITEYFTEEELQLRRKYLTTAQVVMGQYFIQYVFDKDINAFLLAALSQKMGPRIGRSADGIREEFGITEEHRDKVTERFSSAMEARSVETSELYETVQKNLMIRAVNNDIYLTKEEKEQMDALMDYVFEAEKSIVDEVFTKEQREKADGMILALTGGLESPFFSERHMDALGMTGEQKKKFAAINDELKPERDKMAIEFTKLMTEVEKKVGTLPVQDLINILSVFKDYGREIKKRRSEILTSEQIAKAMKLSKLPKALSLSNLLPK